MGFSWPASCSPHPSEAGEKNQTRGLPKPTLCARYRTHSITRSRRIFPVVRQRDRATTSGQQPSLARTHCLAIGRPQIQLVHTSGHQPVAVSCPALLRHVRAVVLTSVPDLLWMSPPSRQPVSLSSSVQIPTRPFPTDRFGVCRQSSASTLHLLRNTAEAPRWLSAMR